ncbi:hypothetical protein D9M68_548080 [compost metagenome]
MPAALAFTHTGQDRKRRQHAGGRIDHRKARLQRRIAFAAAHPGHAGGCLYHMVVHGPAVPVRRAAAKPGDAAIDHARIARAHRLVAQPEALEHPGPQVVDKDVAAAGQLQRVLAPGLVRKIQRQRRLARIERDKGGMATARAAHHVAAAGMLDLGDLRAELRQQERGERPGNHVREVEHTDAGQRRKGGMLGKRHGGPYSMVMRFLSMTRRMRAVSSATTRENASGVGVGAITAPISV